MLEITFVKWIVQPGSRQAQAIKSFIAGAGEASAP